jgi:hypothetical protein
MPELPKSCSQFHLQSQEAVVDIDMPIPFHQDLLDGLRQRPT